MTESIFIILFFATLRLSLPLLFAATGGYFSEKSGVAQLGLEGFLLIGSFTAASVGAFLLKSSQTLDSMHLLICYLSAGLAAAFLAQLFNYLVLTLKSNAIVVGTALNLFVMGIIPILSKAFFNSTGSTPSLEFTGTNLFPFVIVAVVLVFSFWLSNKTIWGLQMKFAGEKASALTAAGVSVTLRRWQSVTLGAFITGLGGAVLSTYLSSAYSPLMSAGRGYIALAALIFSGWRLHLALLASIFFGFCEALQIQIQTHPDISKFIPLEFLQMTPYLATLLVLLFFKSNKNAPAELS